MRVVDQLLLAGSLLPLAGMVLLLWTSFRSPRAEPRPERVRARGDGR